MASSIRFKIAITFLFLNFGAQGNAQSHIDSTQIFLKSKGHWRLPLTHFKKVITNRQEAHPSHGDFTSEITFCTNSTSQVVLAVFGGTVQGTFPVGDTYAVMVRFGTYYITYCGLNKPELKKGDPIRVGQEIGTVYTDSNRQDGKLEMTLSDRRDKLIDPERWFDWNAVPAYKSH